MSGRTKQDRRVRPAESELRGSMPERPEGAVLLLHGGGEHGHELMHWWSRPVLRMQPFAQVITRRGGDRLAVVRLKNRHRGWNGAEQTPLADARWALAQIRARYDGIPITVVGHSLGGRVALHCAGDPGVSAVVGLAPWVAPGDPITAGEGTRVLLMHGTSDRITDPRATQALATRLGERGVDVTWRPVAGEGHAMLRHPVLWHREVADFVVS